MKNQVNDTNAITNWKVLEKEILIDIMVKMIKKDYFSYIALSILYYFFAYIF
jgi:hypothetical protein